jgi:hypothetical protein
MHARTASSFVVIAILAATTTHDARAQEEESRTVGEGSSGAADYLINRRHTVAEAEAGIIALPSAPISGHRAGGNTPFGTIGKGDATLQTGVHLLYRGGREWSIGAGALFGPRPTSDDEYGGASGLSRSHARSYLQLGTEGRYIPVHLKTLEAWVGLTFGAVVVADRYTTNSGDAVPSILGTKEVTIRTEGLSFGLQTGVDWMFAERLVAGLALRLDKWLLPNAQKCGAITIDCATLTGPVEAIEIGVKIGYRLPL